MTTATGEGVSRELEFWFDFGSNYSYLSMMRIEEMAAERGVRIVWKPFLLGPVFKSLGRETSPFVLQKQKGEYVWRDMERQCAKYALPWTRPTTFPRRALLPLRVALAGGQQAWVGAFCRSIMLLNFALDRDIDDAVAVGEVLDTLELPAASLIAAAQSDDIKQAMRVQTDTALARGIFGAPMFFIEGEMFWGNDRLEDALAHTPVHE